MRTVTIFIFLILSQILIAQNQNSETIVVDTLTESIFVLSNNNGGNIGVLVGEDGVLLIDSHRKGLIRDIQDKISQVSALPVKYLINTHWHFDHVEGNETIARSGGIIIAHKNCRDRLAEDQFLEVFDFKQKATPNAGLPVITFSDSLTLFFNDEIINIFHLKNAHSNSDLIIHFEKSDVFHLGDIFVSYGIPFIDVPNGGSFDGMISACECIIENSNEHTQIIPGHGMVSTRQDLVNYLYMLKTIRKRIIDGIERGYSLEQIIESNPAEEYNSVIEKASFIKLYYDSIKKNK